MSRTHDVTISAFDLDRIEAELAAVTEQRDKVLEQIEANHKVTIIIERMYYEAKEQRDRLAEVLNDLWYNYSLTGAAYELIEQTLAAVEGGSDE